ncbi:MAG: hypothetical protein ACFCVG_04175 [Kineosporiaceae bacterium]
MLATRSGIEWRDDVVALPAGVPAVLLSGSGRSEAAREGEPEPGLDGEG